jgi:hypothetical protein
MFANDTAYILLSQADIETTCPAVFHHMRHFGLLMHAGSLDPNGTRQKSTSEDYENASEDYDQNRNLH